MKFVFNRPKAAQAVAYLLWLHGGPLDARLVLKILYLAERQSIVDTGFPMTGDSFVSTRDGPIPKHTHELYQRHDRQVDSDWHRYIVHTEAGLLTNLPFNADDLEELSTYDRTTLQQTHNQAFEMSSSDLIDYLRGLPECVPATTGIPINVEDILRASGYSGEEIIEIQAEARALYDAGSFALAK